MNVFSLVVQLWYARSAASERHRRPELQQRSFQTTGQLQPENPTICLARCTT